MLIGAIDQSLDANRVGPARRTERDLHIERGQKLCDRAGEISLAAPAGVLLHIEESSGPRLLGGQAITHEWIVREMLQHGGGQTADFRVRLCASPALEWLAIDHQD